MVITETKDVVDRLDKGVLPAVVWRIVAPSLTQPRWYEDAAALLNDIAVGAIPSVDAVIHQLQLDQLGRGYRWIRVYYHPPASHGTLSPDPVDPNDP